MISRLFIKRLVISLGLGGLIALLSGLLPSTPLGLVGVMYWGWPLPWISQVVYPDTPKVVLWHFLIIDWIIWAVLFFGVFYAIDHLSKTEISSPDSFVEENNGNSINDENRK